jgi:hypothetical protein
MRNNSLNQREEQKLSQLERDLSQVLGAGDGLKEIKHLLSELSARDTHIVVTSYPACNSETFDARME